ncbi:hypothetical protein HG536_0F00390 [Torulaspora globosa]|uniref:Carbamoyl phosphate synthase ATP-binding domain-containing protein n=1 Tax=Torulaspora globosa TaxID=48254 RepID=A0A7G3ZJM9_9SACH|nr:uncharacterized protein HG536_0F00390 [Torulaspora globosa]QLL33715.1 hypothetical protein HG536_0F00390 [Torulaspora globosa]
MASVPDSRKNEQLSEEEIALYDRQIRLWGMAAQARMRSARVLLINLGSIGTEITKNVVLSGLGSLTILDNQRVTEEDLSSQFFVGQSDVGSYRLDAARSRVLEMNPRVQINFDTDSFESKEMSYFSGFDLVLGTQMSRDGMIRLNKITRHYGIPLYMAGCNGLFAYIFIDLIQFDAEERKLKSSNATSLGKTSANTEIVGVEDQRQEEGETKYYEIITTRNYFKTFEDVLRTASLAGKLNRRQMKRVSSAVPLTFALFSNKQCQTSGELKREALLACQQLQIPESVLKDSYVEQFFEQAGVEFSPVAAIIGGAVAQDVINILGKRQAPLNNFVVLDGITLDMPILEV